MSPYRRRQVLAGLASLGVLSLSGCSIDGNGPQDSASTQPSSRIDTNTDTDSGTDFDSDTDSDSETPTESSTPGVFTDLTVETARTWCPRDEHWEPYYHRTPMPPPGRPTNLTRETAVEYATSYEGYVLTYMAVDEYGAQTPVPPTETNRPGIPAFPDTEMQDRSARVLTALEDTFVVQVSYTRFVEGESRGRYTVNYYVSSEQTIRAEVQGDASPGPNPTTVGTILEC